MIGLAVIFGIIWIIIFVVSLIFGIKLINQNNAWGILLLFIALNVIGLIIGCIVLYNNKNKPLNHYQDENGGKTES